jgi:sugar phosphate isomerase/epimerase
MLEDGFRFFARMWNPILDVFDQCGVRFALEVHPTEIAFDIVTARRAVKKRKAFGFNFDPSQLEWQGIDPVRFLKAFPERIYHVHMKDAAVTLDGESGILSSHLNFGAPGRGWDFRSVGRGDVTTKAKSTETKALPEKYRSDPELKETAEETLAKGKKRKVS